MPYYDPAAPRVRENHYLARFLVSASGRFEEGEDHLRRAIELREALAGERPDDPDQGTELSRSLNNLSELQYRAGRPTEALATALRANTTQQDLVRRWPDDPQLRHLLSLSTRALATINRTLGRRQESEPLYRASVAIIAQVVVENPAVIEYRRVLATSNEELGQELVDQGKLAEGLQGFTQAREQAEIVQRSIPEDTNNLVTLASIHRGIGKALGKQGKPAEGLASLDRAVAIGERIERRDSVAAYDLACTLALCSQLAASLPEGTGGDDDGAARRHAERSVIQLRKAIGAGWKDADWMERDPELAALRDRPDYRELIADLRRAGAPASK